MKSAYSLLLATSALLLASACSDEGTNQVAPAANEMADMNVLMNGAEQQALPEAEPAEAAAAADASAPELAPSSPSLAGEPKAETARLSTPKPAAKATAAAPAEVSPPPADPHAGHDMNHM